MSSDNATAPRPPLQRDQDRQAARQRLAALLGKLLARHWLRQRQALRSPNPKRSDASRNDPEAV